MLHTLIACLAPAALGSEAGGHGRRRRYRHPRPPEVEEERGKWIWTGEGEIQPNSYIYARKLFRLTARPTSAVIKASAESRYRLYVNGNYIGSGPARANIGTTLYDSYEITEHITKGNNVIAFLAHYADYPGSRPGLICKADIQVGEETLSISTDETWRVLAAPDYRREGEHVGEELSFQEVYDAAERPAGWCEVKFKEKGWSDATVVGAAPNQPWGRLAKRDLPELAQEPCYPRAIAGIFNSPARPKDTAIAAVPEIMSATPLTKLTAGNVKDGERLLTPDGDTHIKTPRGDAGVVLILDFGREVFGNLEIGISGSGSGLIDVGYSEVLTDGRAQPDRAGTRHADRLILKKGPLAWQSFSPRAFRYVQLEFRWCTKVVSIDYIRVNRTTYPITRTASFECSDALLNEIWRCGSRTAELAMQDLFIDGLWDANYMSWAGARVAARTAYYAFNNTELLARGLRLVAESQHRDGAMAGTVPPGPNEPVLDYALLWVYSLLDYFAFSDDSELVKELYPNARRLLSWFDRYTDEDGLLADVPGHVHIDRADLPRKGKLTALNCLYYQALRVASALATITGNQHDAERYMESAGRIKVSLNKYAYSPRRGLYSDRVVDGKLSEEYSRQTNALAALFDVADQYQRLSICRQILDGNTPEIRTPYFTSFALEVLYAADLHDEALQMLRYEWGALVTGGATTFGDQFGERGSESSSWSVCPTRDLLAKYVGIKPVLGANRFSVAPHTGGLAWARGSIETQSGPLSVEWRVNRNQMLIRIEAPEGLKVDVYPPGPVDSRVALDGKPYPSRLLVLNGGTHEIKLSPPASARPAKEDKALEPMPIPHVEILGELMTRRRGRLSVTGLTRGTRRRGRRGEAEVEEEEGSLAVEETSVDGVSDAQSVVEGVSDAPQSEGPREPRTRRSRRGGRGRRRSTETEADEPAAALNTPVVEGVSDAQGRVDSPSNAPEGEEPRERRRRPRRGGRGRRRTEHAPVESEQPASEASPQPAAAEEPSEVQPLAEGEEHRPPRRRSRRGGRGRRRPEAATTDATPEAEAPQPIETPAPARAQDHTEPVEGHPEPVEGHPEPIEGHPEPILSQSKDEGPEAEETHARRSRRPRRRRSGSQSRPVDGVSDAAPTVEAARPAPPLVEAPPPATPADEAAPATAHARSRRPRRRKPSATTTDQPVQEVAAPAAEPILSPSPVILSPSKDAEPAQQTEQPDQPARRPRRPRRPRAPHTEKPNNTVTEG